MTKAKVRPKDSQRSNTFGGGHGFIMQGVSIYGSVSGMRGRGEAGSSG